MFRSHRSHQQPILICSVNELPDEQKQLLDDSWAGVFYREVFCRLDEKPFAVLYSDLPSRPNAPVNVLVGLEYLKAGFGWSDAEMYEAFLYNLQVRYALGYDEFGKGYFDLRTVYYFRERLSRYMQEKGVNLLQQAFEQVTDEQLEAFRVQTGMQRMDNTQVSSYIRQVGRLQLLVEVLRRVEQILTPKDRERFASDFAPYLKGHAGQYMYRLKQPEQAAHIQRIGEFMQRLLQELKEDYPDEPVYQMLERVFGEHFRMAEGALQAKTGRELSPTSLQSPDDLEATFVQKGGKGYRGYVANLSETCAPENELQLITQVQVAPNHTADPHLLAEGVPALKQRMELEQLYTDGGHGGTEADRVLNEEHVTHIQTGIRGKAPKAEKLSLADFEIELDATSQPVQIRCPAQQSVPVQQGRSKKGFVARFEAGLCDECPFWRSHRCPTVAAKRTPHHRLYFQLSQVYSSRRRRKKQEHPKDDGNLRAAVEATVRSVKHPFPAGKLPVRGRFRMTCLLVGSAAMANLRRIQRYLEAKKQAEETSREMPPEPKDSFWLLLKAIFWHWISVFVPLNPSLSC
jgi:hypothetical protein